MHTVIIRIDILAELSKTKVVSIYTTTCSPVIVSTCSPVIVSCKLLNFVNC